MNANLVNQLVRPEILELSAYHVPDSEGMIKLDAMENPYLLPEKEQVQLGEWIRTAEINRYPAPHAPDVKALIKTSFGIPKDKDILLGNGSDEIIQIIAMALAQPNAVILGVEPSFVMYKMIATFLRMKYVGIPLRANDFQLDLPAMLEAIRVHQPAVIFLAYPNNPTGNLFHLEDIQTIIEATSGLVVIDEAYHAFAGNSFLTALAPYAEKVVIMRTLSKLGLAGLRLGFLIGDPAWLAEFDKVRLPYNINVLTQKATVFALENIDIFNQQAASIVEQRHVLFTALCDLGLQPFESQANFILCRVPEAETVFLRLKTEFHILIKFMGKAHAFLTDCLRFTVGSPEENQLLIQALTVILKN